MHTITEPTAIFHKRWLNRNNTNQSYFLTIYGEPRQITDLGVPIFNVGTFLINVEGLKFALSIPVNAILNISVKENAS